MGGCYDMLLNCAGTAESECTGCAGVICQDNLQARVAASVAAGGEFARVLGPGVGVGRGGGGF